MPCLRTPDWGDTRLACTLGADGVLRGGKKFVTDATAARLFVVVVDCRGAPALALVRALQLAAGAVTANTLIDQTKRSASVDFSGVKVDEADLITGSTVVTALRDLRLLGRC